MAALTSLFDKRGRTGREELIGRVTDVLTFVVKSGSLPAPPGEDFSPLSTVRTDLPHVAIIPDGATGLYTHFTLDTSYICAFVSVAPVIDYIYNIYYFIYYIPAHTHIYTHI